jgi:hypothetical protein
VDLVGTMAQWMGRDRGRVPGGCGESRRSRGPRSWGELRAPRSAESRLMMLLWAARALLVLAAGSAVALARRRPDHRPFAAFLVSLLLINTMRAVLSARFGLIRPPGLPPFTGAARMAFHADQAGELASAAAFAAVMIWLFSGRRALVLLPGIAWVAAVAYLATHYPIGIVLRAASRHLPAQLSLKSRDHAHPMRVAGRAARIPLLIGPAILVAAPPVRVGERQRCEWRRR